VIRCAYCGKRAHAHLAGSDSRNTEFDVDVCPECGPQIAACLRTPTVRLSWYPDHRTVGWALRRGALIALIIMAVPFVAGILWALIEMITGR